MLPLTPPATRGDPQAVIVTRDLFFGSQVTGTAAQLGLRVVQAMSVSALEEQLATGSVRGVILDLVGSVTAQDVIAKLPVETRPRTVAFGPHVRTDLLQAARDAGFEEVLPRSRFSAELPTLLQRLCDANASR